MFSMSSILFWFMDDRGELTRIVLQKTAWIDGTQPILREKTQKDAFAVRPIHPCAGYLAVAVVPDNLDGNAEINGMPLQAGTHSLRHADRLEMGGNSYWIAANSIIEAISYDPAVQGADQFCFITKAPLVPHQEIVICPGTPGHSCGQIYSKSSWERVMQSPSRMRCGRCGFHPAAASWRPPEIRTTRNIDEILSSIAITA